MAVLPMKCRRYLNERGINFQEIEDPAAKAVILTGFTLPAGQYDLESADVLILLPAGYPDNPPDMFYTSPWLRLNTTKQFPKAADHPHQFANLNWQRWSRHNNAWRPGVDGIWTMIKRIELALAEAT